MYESHLTHQGAEVNNTDFDIKGWKKMLDDVRL